jgi:hypothetical protein
MVHEGLEIKGESGFDTCYLPMNDGHANRDHATLIHDGPSVNRASAPAMFA